ncbi:MAG: sulfite exporter TauE/SafE family protein [Candidatus Peribacteraceae bacterium]|nr:sulfite exporter TauE/SafE family protein [Candidatus Peribacteraceae bacterium]
MPDQSHSAAESAASREHRGWQYWIELLGMLALILVLSRMLRGLGIGAPLAPDGAVGFGAIAFIGLASAASSCMALVGGLLLSLAAAWRETHESEAPWKRFLPLASFNVGRLAGYFVLGGLVGLLGTAFRVSSVATGFLTVIIAAVMVILGLSILRLIPKQFCRIPLPRFLTKRLHALSGSESPFAGFFLGALTFFVPCGFTQSMQLLALTSGSFLRGGLIMFAFALGTLPALLGISLLSSFAEGRFERWFLRFSGVLVLLLGLTSVGNGLALMGISPDRYLPFRSEAEESGSDDPYVTVDAQGRQIITMYVTDRGYSPDSFTIDAGKDTWVYAIAPDGVSGCATFLQAPAFGVSAPIRQGSNWLGPLENPRKDFVLTCSVGTFRADVHIRPS